MNARHSTLTRFFRFVALTATAVAGVSTILLLKATPANEAAVPFPFRVTQTDTQELASRGVARLAAGAVATVKVSQKEKSFLPATVEIHVGQSIEIINDDNTVHNAYCSAGDFKYNSGPQQPGSASSLVFTAPGSYDVRCAIHPKMRLAVVVTP